MTGPLPVLRRRVDRVGNVWHGTPIRTQLTAATAMAATLTIVAVVAVAYVVVRHELLSNIDGQLRNQAANTKFIALGEQTVVQRVPGQEITYVQVVTAAGSTYQGDGGIVLPVDATDTALASEAGSSLRTQLVSGTPYRIYTKHTELKFTGSDETLPVALQIALPLNAANSELHKLRIAFLVLIFFGLFLVIAATWFVVRRTMRPIASLTNAAEQISVTSDLTTRIEDYGNDELGRLASTFNTMLDALEKSLGQQRQLILDASHELRTPLASLRTNVEVLHDVDRLSVDQRRSLLDGIVTQLDELTGLVADVVELARGDAPESAQEELSLDDLVVHAVDRARRHWPAIVFMLATDPVVVRGMPGRLDRAIANLLDNAGKFSPAGSVVDVALSGTGVLTVADRGPGVPEEALEHVFDRFYRADEARALPGSGLGLAIVKQVMDGHRGTVSLSNRPDGGAIVTAVFPVSDIPESDDVPTVEAHIEASPVG